MSARFSGRFSKRPGTNNKGPGGAKKKRSGTMAAAFTASLTQLMDKMDAATPHFVRCIKPNPHKEPDLYDDEMVLRQMRYNGVVSTVQIRRQGYPNRLPHASLFDKFQGLIYNYTTGPDPTQDSSTLLLEKLTELSETMKASKKLVHSGTLEGWLVGSSKAFLKHWHLDLLIAMQKSHSVAAVAIQAKVRMFLCRKRYLQALDNYRDQCAMAATFMMGIGQHSAHTFSALQALADEEARRGPVGLGIQKPEKKKKAKPPPVVPRTAKKIEKEQKKLSKELDKARKAAIKWWFKYERPIKWHVDPVAGKVHQWFHGLITRTEAEDFLMPCTNGTFLFRVSERYHGYALSVKIEGRVKHYKINSVKQRLDLDGVEGDFGSLLELVSTHMRVPLPTQDDSQALLTAPFALVHDFGLGIDNQDVVIKTVKKAGALEIWKYSTDAADEDDGFADLGALLDELGPFTDVAAPAPAPASSPELLGAAVGAARGVAATTGTPAPAPTAVQEPADDEVFAGPAVGVDLKTPRWLRGAIDRNVAVNELARRGLVDGRFVVREKERRSDFVAFAISYSFQKKLYHHILCRRLGGYWALDQTLLQFADGRGRRCTLVAVIGLLQARRAPQLACSLELDAVAASRHRAVGGAAPAPSRGLALVAPGGTPVPLSPLFGKAVLMPGTTNAPSSPKILALAGLGIGGRKAVTPVYPATSMLTTLKRQSTAFLGAPPKSPSGSGGARTGGAGKRSDEEAIYDSNTGRRVTGIPRVKLNEQSSVDDVLGWFTSLGLSQYMKKVVKKKVTGKKLWGYPEKKLRKLVKGEDDFTLLHRALRQAMAYAATVNMVVIEEAADAGGDEVWTQQKGRHGAPFRSVRRENPMIGLEEGIEPVQNAIKPLPGGRKHATDTDEGYLNI
jgi:hypothetical protein